MIRLFIVLIVLNCFPITGMAKGIKYNHNCETISEIKKKVNYSVLTPRKIPKEWTLDTKTSPWIMLHYMDSKDIKLMVGIHLRRGSPLSAEDFHHSQKVDINGNKGYFSEWGYIGKIDENRELTTGGLLNWVQDGTFVEMNSSILSKEKMLEIARSMK